MTTVMKSSPKLSGKLLTSIGQLKRIRYKQNLRKNFKIWLAKERLQKKNLQTPLPGRKVTADPINAMFDTKDSRTGEPIAKGEPVYYITGTQEIVKESTYKGMTEGGKQGEVFAPGEVKKVP